MDLELRPVGADEQPAFARATFAAFGAKPTDDELGDDAKLFEHERSLAVFDRDRIVATAGAFTFELAVPGATVPTAGVSYVGVLPTHRRRGLLRRMMARQLDDIAEREEPVAILTASEGAIYRRFGYGIGTWATRVEVRGRGGFDATGAAGGTCRMIELDEAAQLLPAIYDRARRRRVGGVSRPEAWWDMHLADRESNRDGASALFCVVHEGVDGADAFVTYRVAESWDSGPDHTLKVEQLWATSDAAETAVWGYLLEVDLVRKVQAWGAIDSSLRWRLDDPRRARPLVTIDEVWVRLVDVAAALGARRYAAEDRLVVEVRDPFRPASAGRYAVDGGPDGATVTRVTDDADVVGDVTAFGALYLGGVAASALVAGGRLAATGAEALRRADAFFRWGPAPFCGTEF